MKKIFLILFVSMIILPPAYADEEIQLAAIVSASGSSNIQANKRIYATDINQLSMGSGYASTSRSEGYEFGVMAGIVVAAAIAIAVEDTSGAVSH